MCECNEVIMNQDVPLLLSVLDYCSQKVALVNRAITNGTGFVMNPNITCKFNVLESIEHLLVQEAGILNNPTLSGPKYQIIMM